MKVHISLFVLVRPSRLYRLSFFSNEKHYYESHVKNTYNIIPKRNARMCAYIWGSIRLE